MQQKKIIKKTNVQKLSFEIRQQQIVLKIVKIFNIVYFMFLFEIFNICSLFKSIAAIDIFTFLFVI